MRHALTIALLWIASAACCFASPKAVITGPTGGVPGDILILDASASGGDFFSWEVAQELDGDRPTILPIDNGRKCVVASVPGTYVVFLAVGDKDGIDTIKWQLKVSGEPPKPPAPPAPTPADFAKLLHDAYAAEAEPEKARSVAALASLYRAAAKTTVDDATIKTYAQLFADMKTASASLLSPSAVPRVRKVIGDRLNPLFSGAEQAIDREKVKAEFNAVATALEGLK